VTVSPQQANMQSAVQTGVTLGIIGLLSTFFGGMMRAITRALKGSREKPALMPKTERDYSEWKRKIRAGYGRRRPGVSEEEARKEAESIPRDVLHRYMGEKIGLLPLTRAEIARIGKRHAEGIMPKLPKEAYEDFLFWEYIRDLVNLGEVISDEEAARMWRRWKIRREEEEEERKALARGEWVQDAVLLDRNVAVYRIKLGDKVGYLTHAPEEEPEFRPATEEEIRAAEKKGWSPRYYDDWIIDKARQILWEKVPVAPKLLGPERREEPPEEVRYFADSKDHIEDSMNRNNLRSMLEEAFKEAIARAAEKKIGEIWR